MTPLAPDPRLRRRVAGLIRIRLTMQKHPPRKNKSPGEPGLDQARRPGQMANPVGARRDLERVVNAQAEEGRRLAGNGEESDRGVNSAEGSAKTWAAGGSDGINLYTGNLTEQVGALGQAVGVQKGDLPGLAAGPVNG